jgi:negative regulator of sigma-B (phosphoserine phosphatase)
MKAAGLEWSMASATMPGESESGDRYWVGAVSNGMLFAVIDGLGHGRAAAAAAEIAVATLERCAGNPVIEMLERCHEALLGTRGVAMSLAALNTEDGILSWIGVGNVEGALLHRNSELTYHKLLLRNGVVGVRLPALRTADLAVSPGDLLIMITDGVTSDWQVSIDGHLEAMANGILARGGKGTDDAMVLVARYCGAQP